MFLGGYFLINPIGTAIAATGIIPAKIETNNNKMDAGETAIDPKSNTDDDFVVQRARLIGNIYRMARIHNSVACQSTESLLKDTPTPLRVFFSPACHLPALTGGFFWCPVRKIIHQCGIFFILIQENIQKWAMDNRFPSPVILANRPNVRKIGPKTLSSYLAQVLLQ